MVVYHDAIGNRNKREQAQREINTKLRSLNDNILSRRHIRNSDIDYIIGFITSWERVTIRQFKRNPLSIIRNVRIFPDKLRPYLNKILPVFEFFALTYPSNIYTPNLINRLLFSAKKANIAVYGKSAKNELLIDELTTFYGMLPGTTFTMENVEALQNLLIKSESTFYFTYISKQLAKKLSEHLSSYDQSASIVNHLEEDAYARLETHLQNASLDELPNSQIIPYSIIKQKYEQELDELDTSTTPKRWEKILNKYFNLAMTENEFLLYCINTRQSIQHEPIADVEKLVVILKEFSQGELQKYDIRIDEAIRLMGIDPRKLSYNYRIIYEAIASVMHAQIFKITFAKKERLLLSQYSEDDIERETNVMREMNLWRDFIKDKVYQKIGKLVQSSLMQPYPYFENEGHILDSASFDQCIGYLRGILASSNMPFLLREQIFSAFKVIDTHISSSVSYFYTINKKLEQFHLCLSTYPDLLKLYFEYATLVSNKSSIYARNGFFSSICFNFRFSNINLVKQDIVFCINNFYAPTNQTFNIEMYQKLIFKNCEKVEALQGNKGVFMLNQFVTLLHIDCPDNIRISCLSPFRKWLDAHNVSRPYYEYSFNARKEIIFTNLGYPEQSVAESTSSYPVAHSSWFW